MRMWLITMMMLMTITPGSPQDYSNARKEMVSHQIERRGIYSSNVLKAMRTVPRHLFVPEDLRYLAYEDTPLPIGCSQTISQPYIVAYMTDQLHLDQSDKVLEIGTGSGYQAAVLAQLVDSVFTVEIVPEVGQQAIENLKAAGCDNVYVHIGDGYHGWKEHAPYDAIIVTAAAPNLPRPLLEQLKINGRIIIPVGTMHQVQYLELYKKTEKRVIKRRLLPVRFVPFTRDIE
ncbi:protein-L-isoaspartate(D-aspartate) O-methyltransferase [Marinilabiliaceae bacterium JC017]|nr:protein-L-isoaspartate(D-aspartate) O-methyltransferase [Marinilabiliaceae bacterium JC017]